MARKPNYSFERMQRDRAKQAKQEEKRAARAGAKATAGDAPRGDDDASALEPAGGNAGAASAASGDATSHR